MYTLGKMAKDMHWNKALLYQFAADPDIMKKFELILIETPDTCGEITGTYTFEVPAKTQFVFIKAWLYKSTPASLYNPDPKSFIMNNIEAIQN